MNVIFAFILSISCIFFIIRNPDGFLSALLSGASKSATLCVALLSSYCVFSGLMNVMKDSGITSNIAKILKKPVKKLFRIKNDDTCEAVCMNLSANLLGVSAVATPYGIKSASLMEINKENSYSSDLLFILNSSSLQLIPTSVIAVRTALLSSSPSDVVLPILICVVISKLVGIALLNVAYIPKKSRRFALKKAVA